MTSLQRPSEERERAGAREGESEGGRGEDEKRKEKRETDHWTVAKKIGKNANGAKRSDVRKRSEWREADAMTERTLDAPQLSPISSTIPLNFFFPFSLL